VAVQIGARLVRAVEVEVRDGSARVLKRGSAPSPPEIWSFLRERRDELASAIKSALASGGISTTKVTTSLPRRLVTLKYAQLPQGDAEQIASMVMFEAQPYVPFPLDEVVLAHQVVGDDSVDMATVMIVAARNTLVEDLLAGFDKAGLEVSSISVSSLGLAEHAASSSSPVGLVGIFDDDVDVCVASAGKVLFTRASTLNSSSPEMRIERVASELAISLSAYRNEYRAQPVSHIYVAGDADDVERLQTMVPAGLGANVSRLSGSLLPANDAEAIQFAEAIGLAVSGSGQGITSINLTPASRIEMKAAAKKRVQSTFAMAAAVIVIGLVGFKGVTWLNASRAENLAATKENTRLAAAETALKKSKEENQRVQTTYVTLTSSMPGNKPVVDLVKAVSDAVPPGSGIYLSQLSFERGAAISIHGAATKETAATELVLALQAGGAFRDVRLTYLGDAETASVTALMKPNAEKPKLRMSFTIACKMKGDEPVPINLTGATVKTTTNATSQPAATTQEARR
jgi:Tfp pilus assembly PilM family ATPase/Tfp pilus assembly protein PilN